MSRSSDTDAPPRSPRGRGKGPSMPRVGELPTLAMITLSPWVKAERLTPQERGEETPVRGRSRVRANTMSYHESTDGMKRKRFWMSGDGIGMSFCGLQMIATLILYFALHVSRSDGRI